MTAAAAVVVAGCGGGGDDAGATAKVASLGESSSTTAADSSADASSGDFEDAMLDYASCMREHGIDMDDPQFGSDGRPVMRAGGDAGNSGPGGDGSMREDPDFADAQEACQDLIEGIQGQFQGDEEQQAETQDNLLEFAQCMRDEGVDYPDPQFDENGRPQFDPEDDERMTFDSEDPTFQAASEACQEKLGDTFRPMGGGAPPGSADAGGSQTGDS